MLNFNDYLNIALIYSIIGFAVALYFWFVLKKQIFGGFWLTALVAVMASFFGGILEFLLKDVIVFFSDFMGLANVFPPLFTALFFIWIFTIIRDRDE
jgi:hypothetical protein